MRPEDVAVATITWARTADDEAVLRASLDALAQSGLPVAVADRDGSEPFTRYLGRLPGFQLSTPRGAGLVSQVQASLATAATVGRRFVLYVEPDKAFFFAHRLHEFVRAAPDSTRLGVALASRSADSLATFPPMQRYTEQVINELCGTIVGREGDYSYGPFIVHRALLPDIATLDANLGWGWRHATFVAAARAQRDVVHVTGDYPCPPEQRDEDEGERAHRLRQLSQNILGLIA